jgi:DeoR family fructose operon transcriptional repressor
MSIDRDLPTATVSDEPDEAPRPGGSVIDRRSFRERWEVNRRAKDIIRDKALALVPRRGCIALDASTTVGTIAPALTRRSGLTVATSSYETYRTLQFADGMDPILIAGQSEYETESFVGPLAVQMAQSLHYTRFFASASALSSTHGTSEVSLHEAELKQAFRRVASELILCIDSSKLGQIATAMCFALERATLLITELAPTDPRLEAMSDRVELR